MSILLSIYGSCIVNFVVFFSCWFLCFVYSGLCAFLDLILLYYCCFYCYYHYQFDAYLYSDERKKCMDLRGWQGRNDLGRNGDGETWAHALVSQSAFPAVMLERRFVTIRTICASKLDPTYSMLGFLCVVEARFCSAVHAGLKLTVILMPHIPK